MDYQTAVKVSGGFGGGMYLGSVCGAVTGGIMAIGLKYGGTGMQAGIKTGTIVRQFTDRFKAKHKFVNCPELTGFDISKVDITNPEAIGAYYKEAVAKGTFGKCQAYVTDATTIVNELVTDAPKATSS